MALLVVRCGSLPLAGFKHPNAATKPPAEPVGINGLSSRYRSAVAYYRPADGLHKLEISALEDGRFAMDRRYITS